jgi:hypothetical protein
MEIKFSNNTHRHLIEIQLLTPFLLHIINFSSLDHVRGGAGTGGTLA